MPGAMKKTWLPFKNALPLTRHVFFELNERRIRWRGVCKHATEKRRASGVDVVHHRAVARNAARAEVHFRDAREGSVLRPGPELPIPKRNSPIGRHRTLAAFMLGAGVVPFSPVGVGQVMATGIITRAGLMPVAIRYTHVAAMDGGPVRPHEVTTAPRALVRGRVWLGAPRARGLLVALSPHARPPGFAWHETGTTNRVWFLWRPCASRGPLVVMPVGIKSEWRTVWTGPHLPKKIPCRFFFCSCGRR